MPAQLVPILVSVPVDLLASIIEFPVYDGMYLVKAAGTLRLLVSGTFEVAIFRNARLVDTLSWSSPGRVELSMRDEFYAAGDVLRLDTGGALPVGASHCAVLLWFVISG